MDQNDLTSHTRQLINSHNTIMSNIKAGNYSMINAFKGYSVSQIFELINNASFALRNGLYSSILSSILGGWN